MPTKPKTHTRQAPILSIWQDGDLDDHLKYLLSGMKESPFAICISGERPEHAQQWIQQDWPVNDFQPNSMLKPGCIYIAPEGGTLICRKGKAILEDQNEKANDRELKKLRALFDNAEEGISIISPDGKPVYLSPGAERILGYSLDEMLDMMLFEILHEDDHKHVTDVMAASFAKPGEKIDGGAVRMLRKDGKWRWCEASLINMLHDPDIGGIIDNFRDITELVESKLQSEENQQRTVALINSTKNAMWAVDSSYKLIDFNHSFYKAAKLLTGIESQLGIDIRALAISTGGKQGVWMEHYKSALAGEEFIIEHELVHPDTGETHWLQTRLTPIANKEKITGVAGYSTDITGIVKRTKDLRYLNEKLLLTQRIAKLGYWKLDVASMEVEWSDEIFNIMGWKRNEALVPFEKFRNSVHPDDLTAFDEVTEKALNGAESFEMVHRIITNDGSQKWIKHLGRIDLDDQGRPLTMEGATQDISDVKQTEYELEKRTAFIERAVDNLPIGIAVNETDTGKVTLINKKFAEIYGWPKEALYDIESFFENVYPDPGIRERMIARIMDDIQSGDPERMRWSEMGVTTANGEIKSVNAQNIPLPEQSLMISTVVDVSDQVKRREELVLSNQRFEYACKASFDAIWDYDLATMQIYWGSGLREGFGHKLVEGISDMAFWEALIHPDERQRIVYSFDKALASKQRKTWAETYRMRKSNGTYAFVMDRGYILRDDNGKAYRMVGAIQNITESKTEELKLRLRESVISNTKEAVMISEIDQENPQKDRCVFVNDAFVKMTGLAAATVIGSSAEMLFSSEDDIVSINNFRKAKSMRSGLELELKTHRAAGGKYWMSFSMSPVPDSDGKFTHWVFIMRDITERREYIHLLKKQNKRLREIAFTQSHIVRAPLARMMGLVNLLNLLKKEDEDFDGLLANIKASAQELDEIIKNIVGKTRLK